MIFDTNDNSSIHFFNAVQIAVVTACMRLDILFYVFVIWYKDQSTSFYFRVALIPAI